MNTILVKFFTQSTHMAGLFLYDINTQPRACLFASSEIIDLTNDGMFYKYRPRIYHQDDKTYIGVHIPEWSSVYYFATYACDNVEIELVKDVTWQSLTEDYFH